MAERGAIPFTMGDLGAILLAVSERAPMGLVITSVSEGVVEGVYLSESAVEILGYPREDLMNKNLLDLCVAEGRAQVEDLVRRIAAREVVEPYVETVIQKADGSRADLHVTLVDVAYGGRTLTVNLVSDVTERQRAREHLSRADRLAALGTLSAGVAHEINNPLAFLTLNVDALERIITKEIPDPTARQRALRALGEIRGGAERVAAIVRDLRAFARADDAADSPVELRLVVASAHRLVQHELRHRANVRIDLPPLPPVTGIASRLEQVFVNLLINAAQAFESPPDRNEVHITGGVLDHHVFIEVADNGPGIAPELLGRIFDPFFTTKPHGVGTGLGLSICQGIVTRLSGELTVTSEVGRGTRFRITLPVGPTLLSGQSATAPEHCAP